MIIAELAALGAAFCWAISGLISIYPIRKLGAFAFNRIRMSIVFVLLAGISFITGSWKDLPNHTLQVLMLSGIIGIFLGDTAEIPTADTGGDHQDECAKREVIVHCCFTVSC